MSKTPITKLDADCRDQIRSAVYDYCRYAPNSHLGDLSARDDIRSAFYILRSWNEGNNILVAIGQLERNAYSMMDM